MERTDPLSARVRAYAFDYPKGHQIAPHRHDWAQLIYARAGVMTVATAAGAWVVPPQRAVWVPAGTEHAIHCETPLSMRALFLASGLRRALPPACSVVNVSPLLRALILAGVEAPGAPRRRHLLASLLIEEIRAARVAPLHLPEPEDPRLKRIASAIAAEPGDPRTLAAWSREVGASVRTLSRRFLAETGMTFREWQRQARLLAALVRLAQRESVTVVALDLGYDSPSAFIHAFRRALGTTPRRYFSALEPTERSGQAARADQPAAGRAAA
ncbi:MAG TPA: helix-turn-helix transcriptional regulator [Geminicoccaceae bacterium]|nr:helix-turn-helix transcriptional regulator [Geminicoccaceae bacterium]